jgi:hypothetical protein
MTARAMRPRNGENLVGFVLAVVIVILGFLWIAVIST